MGWPYKTQRHGYITEARARTQIQRWLDAGCDPKHVAQLLGVGDGTLSIYAKGGALPIDIAKRIEHVWAENIAIKKAAPKPILEMPAGEIDEARWLEEVKAHDYIKTATNLSVTIPGPELKAAYESWASQKRWFVQFRGLVLTPKRLVRAVRLFKRLSKMSYYDLAAKIRFWNKGDRGPAPSQIHCWLTKRELPIRKAAEALLTAVNAHKLYKKKKRAAEAEAKAAATEKNKAGVSTTPALDNTIIREDNTMAAKATESAKAAEALAAATQEPATEQLKETIKKLMEENAKLKTKLARTAEMASRATGIANCMTTAFIIGDKAPIDSMLKEITAAHLED